MSRSLASLVLLLGLLAPAMSASADGGGVTVGDNTVTVTWGECMDVSVNFPSDTPTVVKVCH